MYIDTTASALSQRVSAIRRELSGASGSNTELVNRALQAVQERLESRRSTQLPYLEKWLTPIVSMGGKYRVLVTISRNRDAAHSFTTQVGWDERWLNIYPHTHDEGVLLDWDIAELGGLQEGDGSTANPDLVVTSLTGWAEGYATIQPTEEHLATLPAGARSFAVMTYSQAATYDLDGIIITESGVRTAHPDRGITVESLLAQARSGYRAALRARIGSVGADAEREERARREAHRQKTASNFLRFAEREPDSEEHIGKLPFVPHGLSSSRRWGIEIEHPGARGVEAPDGWSRKGDGSLRSAYDGWVEVQDFEPYEREITEQVYWNNCPEAASHTPFEEVYDDERGEYLMVPNDDYIDPRSCESCGRVTRTETVEPQTIRHTAQNGDCKEFVSPILVSMHSNGLEKLLNDLKGRPTNTSAGVHVHVEADDLTPQQVATIVYGYDILEPILEASYRRERRDFCSRREAQEVLAAARSVKGAGFDPESGGRYRTLNTHSLNVHGTLEFRAMGPVYEYDYLVRWAMLLRELVNSVAAGATRKDFAKIKTWDDLVTFIAKFGKEYARAAIYEMTGETGHAAALSKGGEPVTQSALDRDLEEFRARVEEFTRTALTVADLSTLVGAEGRAEV